MVTASHDHRNATVQEARKGKSDATEIAQNSNAAIGTSTHPLNEKPYRADALAEATRRSIALMRVAQRDSA